MSGRKWLDAAQREQLGERVILARANGLPWKVIVRVYGRSRPQLHRYMQEVARKNETSLARNETSSRLNDHAAA